MCGRYVIDDNIEEIEELLREISRKFSDTEVKTGEIFPTETVPVLADGLTPDIAKWGFPNFQNKGVIINARAETAEEKRMFRTGLLNRRCVIPSTGFYEWHNKQKYQFNLADEKLMYLAGFLGTFDNEQRMVILTTAANDSMRPFHDRMPVILPKQDLKHWVGDTDYALSYIKQTQPALIYQSIT